MIEKVRVVSVCGAFDTPPAKPFWDGWVTTQGASKCITVFFAQV
jgi:hypothetical protein